MTDAVDGIETHSIFRTLGNRWKIDMYVAFADLSFLSKKDVCSKFCATNWYIKPNSSYMLSPASCILIFQFLLGLFFVVVVVICLAFLLGWFWGFFVWEFVALVCFFWWWCVWIHLSFPSGKHIMDQCKWEPENT